MRLSKESRTLILESFGKPFCPPFHPAFRKPLGAPRLLPLLYPLRKHGVYLFQFDQGFTGNIVGAGEDHVLDPEGEAATQTGLLRRLEPVQ